MRRLGSSLVGAAVLISAVTVVARVVGFIRVIVLAHTVGTTCLGDVYATANAVPNIVYEVVVGGALTAAVVPLVAAGVAGGDHARVRGTVAALHGWVLLLLLPVTALTYVVSAPLMALLLGSSHECADTLMRSTATEMLWVFLLQIPVYGLTVVAQGALQAHRRFLAPALAPLLSSIVVIGAYLLYAQTAGDARGSLVSLTTEGFLILTVGTTAGVVVLLLTQVPALHRAGLLVRPTLRFPGDEAVGARTLAGSGIAIVAAQWLAYAVAVRLANVDGPEGAVVVFTVAWTVFLLPWSVLVLPIATSVFPRLSGQFGVGDLDGFERTLAGSTRVVVLAATAGGAGLAAAADPVARLMVTGTPGRSSVTELAATLTAFAPGVLGYGVHGHLARALAARHASRIAAVVSVLGWALAAGLAVFLVHRAADGGASVSTLESVAWGFSLGLLVMGALLVIAVGATSGTKALAGLPRSLVAALLAGAAATAAGRTLADAMSGAEGGVGELVTTLVVGLVVAVVFGVVAALIDRSAASEVLGRLRPRASRVTE